MNNRIDVLDSNIYLDAIRNARDADEIASELLRQIRRIAGPACLVAMAPSDSGGWAAGADCVEIDRTDPLFIHVAASQQIARIDDRTLSAPSAALDALRRLDLAWLIPLIAGGDAIGLIGIGACAELSDVERAELEQIAA